MRREEATEHRTQGDRHGRLSLNTATFEQLAALPMVGEHRARALIHDRPFHSWHEVVRVPGFSEARVADLRRSGVILNREAA